MGDYIMRMRIYFGLLANNRARSINKLYFYKGERRTLTFIIQGNTLSLRRETYLALFILYLKFLFGAIKQILAWHTQLLHGYRYDVGLKLQCF